MSYHNGLQSRPERLKQAITRVVVDATVATVHHEMIQSRPHHKRSALHRCMGEAVAQSYDKPHRDKRLLDQAHGNNPPIHTNSNSNDAKRADWKVVTPRETTANGGKAYATSYARLGRESYKKEVANVSHDRHGLQDERSAKHPSVGSPYPPSRRTPPRKVAEPSLAYTRRATTCHSVCSPLLKSSAGSR